MRLSDSSQYRAFGIAYGNGDLQAATRALEECLSDTALSGSSETRSFLLRELAGVLLEAGDEEGARERLLEAEAVDGDSFLTNYQVANFYLSRLNQPSAALMRAVRATECLEVEGLRDPTRRHWSGLITALRGRCLAELGRVDEAAKQLAALQERVHELVVDHAIELCELLMTVKRHESLAREHLVDLAQELRRNGATEHTTIADRIDTITGR
jgi:tetratricopeptide (TPR) repeat protein